MDFERLGFVGGASAVVLVTLFAFVLRRHLAERRSRAAQARAREAALHVPVSLHPVIDPSICIGSLSCVKACPEGDILGIIDGSAALIEGANCIGHGRCAAECPVDAIRLVFGTSERGVDLPEVDAQFESSRPGIHVVGELGGMGLVKNAVTQGVQVAEALAQKLGPSAGRQGLDVLVVGAGPAGLATAIGARAAGLAFRIIDRGGLGGTMAQYPRQKVVMSETVRLPIVGRFGKSRMSKEQLIEAWQKACEKAGVEVEGGTELVGIEGNDGAFVAQTSRGPVAARKIVLAVGRRGAPRKLGVPGEDLDKVTYRLADPEQYEGRRVLVVGGGDSALEAACALAATPGTEVTLSYRGPQPGRGRRENQEKVAALAGAGRIRVVPSSEVAAIGPAEVTLSTDGGEHGLPNDYVIACTGGELPSALLARLGIDMERHHGQAAVPSPTLARGGKAASPRASRWLVVGLSLAALAVLALLAWHGRSYYLLDRTDRLRSPLRESLRPGGPWGHGIGIAATLVMLTNFLYAARKHLRSLKGLFDIRSWLSVHAVVGLVSPLVIAFHAAFQWNNLIATVTFVSLTVVVGAGLVGRFVYGLVPRLGGVEASVAMLEARWQRDRERVRVILGVGAGDARAQALLAEVGSHQPRARTLVGLVARMPFEWLRVRRLVRGVRRLVPQRAAASELRRTVRELVRLRGQIAFDRSLRRLLSGWRLFHVTLSILLVAVIAAHIGVSWYLGYRWVLR